ncbi:hypothetical protein LTR08_000426 [Meristemomyces frigidus]|nr:hypothetical protein LTR08_000426 [Meristemomyces frigidus]
MPPARFWEFAHLTDNLKTMPWLDRIPRAGNLWIGGLHALYQQPALFAQAAITHVVTVLDYDIYATGELAQYEHLMLRVDDDPNEDLLAHFKASTAFIAAALEGGGGVFVHCAMGKSRSAATACAFLMWKTAGLSPEAALEQVCEGRPVCSPNPGFMEQLGVWRRMLDAGADEARAGEIYREWRENRFTGDWWTWDKRSRAAKL